MNLDGWDDQDDILLESDPVADVELGNAHYESHENLPVGEPRGSSEEDEMIDDGDSSPTLGKSKFDSNGDNVSSKRDYERLKKKYDKLFATLEKSKKRQQEYENKYKITLFNYEKESTALQSQVQELEKRLSTQGNGILENIPLIIEKEIESFAKQTKLELRDSYHSELQKEIDILRIENQELQLALAKSDQMSQEVENRDIEFESLRLENQELTRINADLELQIEQDIAKSIEREKDFAILKSKDASHVQDLEAKLEELHSQIYLSQAKHDELVNNLSQAKSDNLNLRETIEELESEHSQYVEEFQSMKNSLETETQLYKGLASEMGDTIKDLNLKIEKTQSIPQELSNEPIRSEDISNLVETIKREIRVYSDIAREETESRVEEINKVNKSLLEELSILKEQENAVVELESKVLQFEQENEELCSLHAALEEKYINLENSQDELLKSKGLLEELIHRLQDENVALHHEHKDTLEYQAQLEKTIKDHESNIALLSDKVDLLTQEKIDIVKQYEFNQTNINDSDTGMLEEYEMTIGGLEETIMQHEETMRSYESKIENLNELVQHLQIEKNDLLNVQSSLELQILQHDDIEDVEPFKKQIASLEADTRESLELISSLQQKLQELSNENKELFENKRSLEEELAKYGEPLENEQLISEYEGQLIRLEEKLLQYETEKSELLKHQGSLKEELQNARQLNNEKESVDSMIQELKVKIENLSQELVHEKESNSKYEQTLSNYEDEILKLKSNIENITNEKNELEKLRNEISKEIVDKNEVSKDIIDENKVSNNNNEDIIRKYEGQIEILESKIEKYECSKLESLQHQQELENEILTLKNLKKDETDIKTYEERISNLLQQLEQNEDDKTELLSRLQTLEEQLESTQNNRISSVEDPILQYEERIASLVEQVQQFENEKSKLLSQLQKLKDEVSQHITTNSNNEELIRAYEEQIFDLESKLETAELLNLNSGWDLGDNTQFSENTSPDTEQSVKPMSELEGNQIQNQQTISSVDNNDSIISSLEVQVSQLEGEKEELVLTIRELEEEMQRMSQAQVSETNILPLQNTISRLELENQKLVQVQQDLEQKISSVAVDDDLSNKLSALEDEVSKLEQEKTQLLLNQSDLKESLSKYEDAGGDVTYLEEYESRINALELQLSQANLEKSKLLKIQESLENELTKYSEPLDNEEIIAEYETQIIALEEKLLQLENERDELLKTQSANLDGTVSLSQGIEVPELTIKIQNLENKVTILENEKQEMLKIQTSLEEELIKYTEMDVNENTLTQYEEKLAEYQSQLHNLQEKIIASETERSDLLIEISNLDAEYRDQLGMKEQEYNSLKTKHQNELETMMSSQKHKISQLETKVKDLLSQLNSIQKEKSDLEGDYMTDKEKLKSVETSYKTLNENYENLLKELESKQSDQSDKYNLLSTEFEELQKSKSVVEQELMKARQYIEEVESSITDTYGETDNTLLEESLNTIEEKQKTIFNLNKELEALKLDVTSIKQENEERVAKIQDLEDKLSQRDIQLKQFEDKLTEMSKNSTTKEEDSDIMLVYETLKEDHNSLLNNMKELQEKQGQQIKDYLNQIETLQNQTSQMKLALEELEQKKLDFKWIEEQYQQQQLTIEELRLENVKLSSAPSTPLKSSSSSDVSVVSTSFEQKKISELEEKLMKITTEKDQLLERLDVESQVKQYDRLQTALNVLSMENEELRTQVTQANKVIKALHDEKAEVAFDMNLITSKNEAIKTLRREKEQLSNMLHNKNEKYEKLLNENITLKSYVPGGRSDNEIINQLNVVISELREEIAELKARLNTMTQQEEDNIDEDFGFRTPQKLKSTISGFIGSIWGTK